MKNVTEYDRPQRQDSGFKWRWVLTRLLLVLPILQLYFTLKTIRPPGESDYYVLFVHAELARTNQPLYWPWPEYGPHIGAGGLRYPADRPDRLLVVRFRGESLP